MAHAPSGHASSGVNILAYGSPSSTMSGDLLLLVENVIKESQGKIQIIDQSRGLAFRKNSTYLLTTLKHREAELNRFIQKSKPLEKKFQIFETSRSLLVLSYQAPIEFIQKLKDKQSDAIQHQGVNRYWDDLKWSKIKGGIAENSQKEKFPYYYFDRKNWNIEKNWKFSFFITYKLSFEGQEFNVTVLPKSFGGLERITNTLKSNRNANTLILSTGDITPAPEIENTDSNSLVELSKQGHHVISASSAEVIGLKKFIEPYNLEHSKNAALQFTSANILVEDEAGGKSKPLFEPYVFIEKNGIKFAIIGVASSKEQNAIEKASAKNTWLKKIKIIDPVPILKDEILPKIHSKCDVVVLITNLSNEEYGKLYSSLNGVDLVFHRQQRVFDWSLQSASEFSDYRERVPQLPIDEIVSGDVFISKTNLKINKKKMSLVNTKILLDQSINSDSDKLIDDVYEEFSNIFSGKDIVLPDHKRIYPNEIILSKEEFANLAAELMRREFNAEIGVFAIQEQNSNIVGEQEASLIKTWVKPNEQVEVLYLTGSDLKSLINLNKSVNENQKLVIAGIDNKFKITGISVRDNELYRIAISSLVSSNPSVYLPVTNAKSRADLFKVEMNKGFVEAKEGKPILMSDFLINSLRGLYKTTQNLPESEFITSYKNFYEGKSISKIDGYWINEIKNIQIEYSQLTTTDASAFSNLQDSRLKTVDQRYFSSNLSYLATYRKYPFVNEIGLKTQYAKQELLPSNSAEIKNILSNDILIFANIGLPIYSVTNNPNFATDMGPYIEMAYNTEFEKNGTADLKRNLLSSFGWKLMNGNILKSAKFAMVHERKFASDSNINLMGFSSRVEISKSLFDGTNTYRSDIEYRYFFDGVNDLSSDLRSRFSWDQYYDLKVFDNLTFGPFLKYYSLTKQSVQETTSQVLVGVSLNFSNMWKSK